MKTPNVGDVVTIVLNFRVVRATIRRSYKRRFVAETWVPNSYPMSGDELVGLGHTELRSYERFDEGRLWVRGWDDETALAFRAEKALESCR